MMETNYKLLFKAELVEAKDDISGSSLPIINNIGHQLSEKDAKVTFDIADTSNSEAIASMISCKEEHREELRNYILESSRIVSGIKQASRLNLEEIAIIERLFHVHVQYGRLIDGAISELINKALHLKAAEQILNGNEEDI